MDLIAIARWIPTKRDPKGDDGVDRLHYLFTPAIICGFAVLVGIQHYVGDPIACLHPDHLTGAQKKYANSACWIKNTYYLHIHADIPKEVEKREEAEILYYQWLPLLLVTQAILFYIPHALWSALNSKSGVDADNILETSEQLEVTLKMETRDSRLKLITNQIRRFISSPRNRTRGVTLSLQHCVSSVCCCICGKRFGNYLTLLYITVKFLYIGNVALQMYLLGPVFKTAFHEFGWNAVQNFHNEEDYVIDQSIFPKVTMCDFEVRRLGNVHRYTTQCVLSVNMFAEKMYLFLWFWFVMLLIVTTFNVIMWIMRTAAPGSRYHYIEGHLDTTGRLTTERKMVMVNDFVHDYLKHDGVFLIRLIGYNTSQLTAADVTASLWDGWLERRGDKKPDRKPTNGAKQEPEGESQPPSRRRSIEKPPLPVVSSSSLDSPEVYSPPGGAVPAYPGTPPYNPSFHLGTPPHPGTPQLPAFPAPGTPGTPSSLYPALEMQNFGKKLN